MKNEQVFNPIIGVTRLPLFGAFSQMGVARAHTVSVHVTSAQESFARTGESPGLRDRLRRRYWHYEIDMANHPVVMRFTVPAKEEAFDFTAIVTLLWAVQDPVEVALTGIRDLKPVIWTFLDQALRGVSRQFGIEAVGAAETEMRLTLEKQSGQIGFGLKLPMLAVSLRLDDETERYLSERVGTDRAGNLAGDRHELARIRADFERQQAEWAGLLEQEQALHRQELDAAAADHDRQIENLNAVHATSLKSQRLDFYRAVLGEGGRDALLVRVLEHPGDLGAVLEMIDQGSEKHYQRSREIFRDLVKERLCNAAEAESLTQETIGQLQAALGVLAPRPRTKADSVSSDSSTA